MYSAYIPGCTLVDSVRVVLGLGTPVAFCVGPFLDASSLGTGAPRKCCTS
jgi:hypothetical protein